MLAFEDALRIVLDHLPDPRLADPEPVPLADAAGRVLARDILADRDSPPFSASAMDGFAVRAEDAIRGAVLRRTEEIVAGRLATRPVAPGQAAAIMTGAPLPEGADSVVKVEQTEAAEDGRSVLILTDAERGGHIRRRGENRRAGETILVAGTEIRATHIGALATVGHATVPVFRRPSVAIATTGDEIVPVEEEPGPGRIRNSNAASLRVQARQAGARTVDLGVVPDDGEATRRAIRAGARNDVVLISGGVSMGTRDLVPGALRDEGVEILFHRVRIKPGRPLLFGRTARTVFFGLPGNPVSTFVTFELFVRPVLRRLTGHAGCERRIVKARLADAIPRGGSRRLFSPARVTSAGEGPIARPIPWRGSGDAFGLALANALLIVPENAPARAAGASVDVLLLEGAPEDEAAT